MWSGCENPLFTTNSPVLKSPLIEAFENIVRKGENAGNQHFLLFLQSFFNLNEDKINVIISAFSAFSALLICTVNKVSINYGHQSKFLSF